MDRGWFRIVLVYLAILHCSLLGSADSGLCWWCWVVLIHHTIVCWSLFIVTSFREAHQKLPGDVWPVFCYSCGLRLLEASCYFCGFRPIDRVLHFLLDQPPIGFSWMVFVNGLSCNCWFCEQKCWYQFNRDCIFSTEILLNRSTSIFALLSTSGGWWGRRDSKIFKNHY